MEWRCGLDVREAAYEYAHEFGFGITRVKSEPGCMKQPRCKGWQMKSHAPRQFTVFDNIAFLPGTLSGNNRDGYLLTVDVDRLDVLERADEFLPVNGLIEGRASKRKSHRHVLAYDVPDWAGPGPDSKIKGGPGGRYWYAKGVIKPVIELKGTGQHIVVPPSLHESGERREWDCYGEPVRLSYRDLWDRLTALAACFGCEQRDPERANPASTGRAGQPSSRMLVSENIPFVCEMPVVPPHRMRAAFGYISGFDPAVSTQGGNFQTWKVAKALIRGFDLTVEEAMPLIWGFNMRCRPQWSTRELLDKLIRANAYDGERGWLYKPEGHKVFVEFTWTAHRKLNIGLNCSDPDRDSINLDPDMAAGFVKWENGTLRPGGPVLVREILQLPLAGREVILCPPSTIHTSKEELEWEYTLANLVRAQGATVKALHIPVGNGRRATLNSPEAKERGKPKEVTPPHTREELVALQGKATRLRAKMDRSRKKLPRNSVKFTRAVAYLKERNLTELDAAAVEKAVAALGVSRRLLYDALSSLAKPKT